MAIKKTTRFDFETSLKELESIVTTMEQGGISLEESLKLFERGVKLTQSCQQVMKAAEQKVKILTATGLLDFKTEMLAEVTTKVETGDLD